jgi:hypothetical protein
MEVFDDSINGIYWEVALRQHTTSIGGRPIIYYPLEISHQRTWRKRWIYAVREPLYKGIGGPSYLFFNKLSCWKISSREIIFLVP